MSFSGGTVSVADSATLIVAANSDRIKVVLKNVGGSTIYVGDDGSVTVNDGFPLLPNQILTDTSSLTAYYGIVASGTVNVSFVEQDLSGVN